MGVRKQVCLTHQNCPLSHIHAKFCSSLQLASSWLRFLEFKSSEFGVAQYYIIQSIQSVTHTVISHSILSLHKVKLRLQINHYLQCKRSSISLTRAQTKKPNIVWVLTDDQDKTNELVVNKGITFKNGFVHSPICCISRSSYMSGRYVHNNHCVSNGINGNCSSPWWQQNIQKWEKVSQIPQGSEYGTHQHYANMMLD